MPRARRAEAFQLQSRAESCHEYRRDSCLWGHEWPGAVKNQKELTNPHLHDCPAAHRRAMDGHRRHGPSRERRLRLAEPALRVARQEAAGQHAWHLLVCRKCRAVDLRIATRFSVHRVSARRPRRRRPRLGPRNIHVAAAATTRPVEYPRGVAAAHPRGGRGVAATIPRHTTRLETRQQQ